MENQNELLKKKIKELKKISKTIMNDLDDALRENEVKYYHKVYHEIVVPKKSKKTIKRIISEMSGYNEEQIKLLLDVVEIKGSVVIRLKFDY